MNAREWVTGAAGDRVTSDKLMADFRVLAVDIEELLKATASQTGQQVAQVRLAAAMEPGVRNREAAQAWLKFKGYEPHTLKIGPLTRLGGRMTSANVAFDDHPNDKRFSDRIESVTVDSVFTWLQRSGLGGAPVAMRL